MIILLCLLCVSAGFLFCTTICIYLRLLILSLEADTTKHNFLSWMKSMPQLHNSLHKPKHILATVNTFHSIVANNNIIIFITKVYKHTYTIYNVVHQQYLLYTHTFSILSRTLSRKFATINSIPIQEYHYTNEVYVFCRQPIRCSLVS